MTTSDKFCKTLPQLRKRWSAHSLKAYMTCPRLYQYTIVERWGKASGSLDQQFGAIYHQCLEAFDRALLSGSALDEATICALSLALTLTEDTDGVFFGGAYLTAWRCTNRSRKEPCPERKWHPQSPGDLQPPLTQCPGCGSEIVTSSLWVPQNKYKNRETLLRTVLEYCDAQPDPESGLRPYRFPDGQDALEIEFELPLPLTSPDGDPYVLGGIYDGFIQVGKEVAPRERKTTKTSLGRFYFDRYEPDVQIDTYDLATEALFPSLHSPGILLEATSVGIKASAIGRRFISVPVGRRAEWLGEIQYWIKRAEADALAGYFPKNTASCNAGAGCPFRSICRLAPEQRGAQLAVQFERKEDE